jgi:hypothetical protein
MANLSNPGRSHSTSTMRRKSTSSKAGIKPGEAISGRPASVEIRVVINQAREAAERRTVAREEINELPTLIGAHLINPWACPSFRERGWAGFLCDFF